MPSQCPLPSGTHLRQLSAHMRSSGRGACRAQSVNPAAIERLLPLPEAVRYLACSLGAPGVNENPVVAGALDDGAALKDLKADAPAPMSSAQSCLAGLTLL